MQISMHQHEEDGEIKVSFSVFDHNGPIASVCLREANGQEFIFFGRDRDTLLKISDAFRAAGEAIPVATVEPISAT